jgi:AraC-like DNA-binding protein
MRSIERPVLPTATGAYEARPPVESLRDHFSRIWRNVLPDSGAPIAVVPDGCIDLEWIDGKLRVAGPDQEVKCESLPPGATVIGFRFCPGAASLWLGVPASEIVGARVPLDVFWGPDARSIAEWVGCASDPAGITRRLEVALARRAATVCAPDRAASDIRHLLQRAPALQTDVVRQLCAELGVSERTLRRRCHEAFGYGPKTLQRIVRFQRYLHLAREPDAGVAGLASELGYADQAHLTREARRMAGLTPAMIREQLAR